MTTRALPAALALALLVTACGGADGTTAGPSATPSSGASASRTAMAADRPAADPGDVEALVDGFNRAGARLFLAAAEAEEGDLVLSPASIGIAFAMAEVGATGRAAAALAELFHDPGRPVVGEARLSAVAGLLHQLSSTADGDGPVLELANQQFPDVAFTPGAEFTRSLESVFGAEPQSLPLQDDPDGSRRDINGYVADRTRELIPELLPEGFITPSSVLVLVNALYLQADWAMPFGKYPTEEGAAFTRLDGSTTTAALMDDRELVGPGVDGDGYVAAAKPYEGGALDVLVVVPDTGRFEEVQARLGGGLLEEVAAASVEQSIQLQLPRSTSTATLDLRQLIEDGLEVDGIFSDGYDGIAPEIELTGAVHGADISTDEIGTVAAAATALEFQESGAGEADLVVRADRPFLYAIRHLPTGAVLFLGRVVDPVDPGSAIG